MTKRVAVIAQARMGSTRLPGKVLEPIAGRAVMTHVLQRARAIPGVDVVCCATTTAAADNSVAAEAAKQGFEVHRGSENDVLERYAEAAERLKASMLIRITCDCPLLDPFLCGDLLRLCHAGDADYGATNLTATWPHGLDCEAFTAQALRNAQAEATSAYDREHVTAWMRRNPSFHRVSLDGPGGDAARMRWTVDYPEDLSFLRALAGHCDLTTTLRWQEIAAVVEKHPELKSINAIRRNPERPGGTLDATSQHSSTN